MAGVAPARPHRNPPAWQAPAPRRVRTSWPSSPVPLSQPDHYFESITILRIRRYRGKPCWRRHGLTGKPGFSEPKPMARYDFGSPRVYVDQPLQAGVAVALAPPQAHYLTHVL